MTCKECGGDVVKTFVGPTVKYVHAVKGIDHGPLPIEVPTSRPRAELSPPDRTDSTGSQRAPRLPAPARGGTSRDRSGLAAD